MEIQFFTIVFEGDVDVPALAAIENSEPILLIF